VEYEDASERVIDCRRRGAPRPARAIVWDELTDENIASIPLLAALRPPERR
jgi:hypothetical protein